MEPPVERTEKNTAIMRLEAKAELPELQALRDRFERLIVERIHYVLLDLSEAEYVNSSVLAFLVDLKKRSATANVTLTLINVSDRVLEIFRTTRLDTFLLPSGGQN